MGVPGLFGWVNRKFKKAVEKPPWNPQYRKLTTSSSNSSNPMRKSRGGGGDDIRKKKRTAASKDIADEADDELTDAGQQTEGETKDSSSASRMVDLDARPPFEFDNLYLDLNGTIHPSVRRCVVDGQLDFDEFFVKFCNEIRETVRRVKPTRVLFLAVDGVAPRAKMAQQRKRRFTKGKDARETAEVNWTVVIWVGRLFSLLFRSFELTSSVLCFDFFSITFNLFHLSDLASSDQRASRSRTCNTRTFVGGELV